jgi:acetyltransferase-like isoleucine patch superfamily enzyme
MLRKLRNLIKPFLVVSYEFTMSSIFSLPRYTIFNYLKVGLLRVMGAKIGNHVIIYPGVWILPGRNLTIQNNVSIAKDCIIHTEGYVFIGERTLIGYRTQIYSSNHSIPPIGIAFPISGDSYKPIKIEKDVWIGASCIILPGVTIEEGAVIAAGSIVTKNVRANSVVAGVPAQFVRFRDS